MSQGVKVQRRRIRDCVKRVDPVGRRLRTINAIRRRIYNIHSPLSLWHMDGNHKLIRKGITINYFSIIIYTINYFKVYYSKVVTSFIINSNVALILFQSFRSILKVGGGSSFMVALTVTGELSCIWHAALTTRPKQY